MRETRPSGSEGGGAGTNRPSLPLSRRSSLCHNSIPRPALPAGHFGKGPLRWNAGRRPSHVGEANHTLLALGSAWPRAAAILECGGHDLCPTVQTTKDVKLLPNTCQPTVTKQGFFRQGSFDLGCGPGGTAMRQQFRQRSCRVHLIVASRCLLPADTFFVFQFA
jgi:hypothetical protein